MVRPSPKLVRDLNSHLLTDSIYVTYLKQFSQDAIGNVHSIFYELEV